MLKRSRFGAGGLLIGLLLACQPAAPRHEDAEQAILAQERRALEQWSDGNPLGYLEVDADEVTYFDDIGAHSRVDGIENMRAYLTSLKGKIPPHRYEVVEPKVQLYDDVGVLTLHYEVYGGDPHPISRWKATSVYRWADDEWRIVHAHWSLVKGGEGGGPSSP